MGLRASKKGLVLDDSKKLRQTQKKGAMKFVMVDNLHGGVPKITIWSRVSWRSSAFFLAADFASYSTRAMDSSDCD